MSSLSPLTKKRRESFSVETAKSTVATYRASGISQRKFCEIHGVSQSSLSRWVKIDNENGWEHFNDTCRKRRPSCYPAIEAQLMELLEHRSSLAGTPNALDKANVPDETAIPVVVPGDLIERTALAADIGPGANGVHTAPQSHTLTGKLPYKLLLNKASELAKDPKVADLCTNFKASKGWLYRATKRRGIHHFDANDT